MPAASRRAVGADKHKGQQEAFVVSATSWVESLWRTPLVGVLQLALHTGFPGVPVLALGPASHKTVSRIQDCTDPRSVARVSVDVARCFVKAGPKGSRGTAIVW